MMMLSLKRRTAFYVFLLIFCMLSCSRQTVYPVPVIKGEDISIDAATLQEEIPQFFTYMHKDRYINFFVIKVEGRILSFLDACTKCHPRKLGFRFGNGSVYCRACDEHYPVSEIEDGFGSCYPIKIEGRTEGARYLLDTAELVKNGEKFFR
jgi:uncharacterized membrane protein